MSTIEDALRQGVVDEFMMPEHDGREPRRRLLLATDLFDWIDGNDELYKENWAADWGGRTRFEHLEQTFADFRCDERVLVGDLNRLAPNGKGLWKIHSPGLRVFGWVPAIHEFLAVSIDFTAHTHGPASTVKANMKAVEVFARKHRLTETILRGDRLALFPPQT